ncbi:hypothetical protein EON79_09575 [bacterium]|nr:MAG: hypothetical protein EON79_09575 [bacterium]
MNFPRITLTNTVETEGKALHGGGPSRVRIHPGEDGIAFRTDSGRTPARPENVTDTTRSTRLGDVGTIEHLMSALAGLGVTDAEIEVEGGELPGLDGSAAPWCALLREGGLIPFAQGELPPLFRRLFLQEENIKIAVAKGNGHWRYEYYGEDRWPGEMFYESTDAVADYETQIAPSRTFALSEQVPQLLQHGLGLGLDETSCLVLGPDGYFNAPRFPDEPARHKLLDLIGDLYLSGVPIGMLSVVAERSGHRAHIQAAKMLAEALGTPG